MIMENLIFSVRITIFMKNFENNLEDNQNLEEYEKKREVLNRPSFFMIHIC